ncbi:MAG TPA: hypothetical protein VFU02_25165 [Polyangiaceae bacterium]|nr:hypothetical protein [Polyangiaceae bacterium]
MSLSTGPGRIAEPSTAPSLCTRKVARCLVALLLTALCFVARPVSADEPEREVRHDATAYPAPSTRLPLFAVGAATSLVWYGAAVGGAYLYPTANGADELKIPLAGPWMSLAETGCPSTTPDCSTFWMVVGGIMKGFSGIGQAGGLLLMIEGLFLPTVEPRPLAGRARWNATSVARSTHQTSTNRSTPSAASSLLVLPAPLPGGGGLSVVGLF